MDSSNIRKVTPYFIWIIGTIIIFLVKSLLPNIFNNSIFFSLGFVFLLFLPGWLLGHLFRIKTIDLISRILIYFVLGLGFYLVINLISIFIGLDLRTLTIINFGLITVLFLGTFLYDYQISYKREYFRINTLWRRENIYYLIPIMIGIFILWLLILKGPNLNGDPYFHLSIMYKALVGNALDSRSLAFTKNQAINPAYIYPVWQIFLAFISKIFSLSIFQVWTNIIYILAIISFLAWYLLAKVIFNSKVWTVFALSLMMIFTFYAGPGYLFSRLGVPDTLAQLVILPLSMAFFLKYVFEGNRQNAIITAILSFILLAIHGPHYFYLLITIFFFGIFYAILFYKDKNYRETILKILKIFLLAFMILILLALAIELKSKTVIATISDFYKSSGGIVFSTNFAKFGQVYKIGYFLLPIGALFLIKSRRFLFVIVSMFLGPIIYWTPLKDFFNNTLSGVFTDRLLTNTSLYFLVFTIILGGLIILINKYLPSVISAIILLFLVITELLTHYVSDFTYFIFYDKTTNIFMSNYACWFFTLGLTIALIIYLYLRSKSVQIEFNNKNLAANFLLILTVSFVLISPSFANAQKLKEQEYKKGEDFFLTSLNNDRESVFFINELPPKSVVLANSGASQSLATMEDQYMAYNVGSAYEKKFKSVFNGNISDVNKLEIVTSPKWAIDYVYLVNSQEDTHFRNHPEIYQLVYEGKSKIYKIVKTNEN